MSRDYFDELADDEPSLEEGRQIMASEEAIVSADEGRCSCQYCPCGMPSYGSGKCSDCLAGVHMG